MPSAPATAMSKFSLAIVAGTSAAVGAATTAAFYGIGGRKKTDETHQTATTTTTVASPDTTRTGPAAPVPATDRPSYGRLPAL